VLKRRRKIVKVERRFKRRKVRASDSLPAGYSTWPLLRAGYGRQKKERISIMRDRETCWLRTCRLIASVDPIHAQTDSDSTKAAPPADQNLRFEATRVTRETCLRTYVFSSGPNGERQTDSNSSDVHWKINE
jgi:hypothetical protein